VFFSCSFFGASDGSSGDSEGDVARLCVCVSSEAHLTVLVLNLMTMKLRDFRKDIDIADDQLYERCLRDDIISAEVGLVEIYS